jgi:ubiquilin
MNQNVRNIVESNIPLREIFEDPEFLRQLTSPETMQVISYITVVT